MPGHATQPTSRVMCSAARHCVSVQDKQRWYPWQQQTSSIATGIVVSGRSYEPTEGYMCVAAGCHSVCWPLNSLSPSRNVESACHRMETGANSNRKQPTVLGWPGRLGEFLKCRPTAETCMGQAGAERKALMPSTPSTTRRTLPLYACVEEEV